MHNFLITNNQLSPKKVNLWLMLSLTLGAIYGLLALQQAFSAPYIIQDDARQHVFWMLRFVDPDLFPHDLIADYFQSVAPAGYSFLYKIAAMIGINPVIFSKIVPIFIGLICTYYLFNLSLAILPIPLTGFIATLLLNQSMWMKDDIASGTPRAFVYPIFIAFLFYLVKNSILGTAISMALLGLFYPQYVLVASAILVLRLFLWENGKIKLNYNHFKLVIIGLIVAFLILLPYSLSSSVFGPSITKAEAQQLPEFLPGGRGTFFHYNAINYWFTGKRSGMFPTSLFTPVTLCAGLILPILLLGRSKIPVAAKITNKIWILPQLFIGSVSIFFLAHAVLFKLHLPSRYTGLSFRIIIALMAAFALTFVIDLANQLVQKYHAKKIVYFITLTVITIPLICYPSFVEKFPSVGYQRGRVPELYQFLQQQPKNSMIASLSEEANHLPSFAQRSILIGREYGIPYQRGYYRQFRQRINDLIQAQYSQDPIIIKQFIAKYGINLWLLDSNDLTSKYLENYGWLAQFDGVKEAIERLKKGQTAALTPTIPKCKIWENPGLILLDTKCVEKQLSNKSN